MGTLAEMPSTHSINTMHSSHKDAWRRVKSDDPISKITDLNLAHATGQGTCPMNTNRYYSTTHTLIWYRNPADPQKILPLTDPPKL